jgi:hypothetical protein
MVIIYVSGDKSMGEKLAIVEDVLLRSFFSGLLLFMFSYLIYLFFNDLVISMWTALYGLDEQMINIIIMGFYGITKILLFVLFLVPAIGIHWARKAMKTQLEKAA